MDVEVDGVFIASTQLEREALRAMEMAYQNFKV